jgi:hypothetical protein
MKRVASLLAVLLSAACDDRSRIDPELRIDSGAEANVEPPTYRVDTMAWVREGRVVLLNGQGYHPVGMPIGSPIVKEVGEFEGMKLYATADDEPPYDRLLIPVAGGWQILEPATGAADTTAAAVPTDTAADIAAAGTAR